VELISQGNLDVRIQIDSQDEFGRLAEEFNNMVELRKQADDILHQKIEELRRSNAELERYASVASHDLQEPLRIVINYLQILSNKYKDKLDEEARHCIDRSMHNANRMSQLIKDLLLYSHAGMHDRPFESVDCNRILEQVLVLLKPSIKENNALIEYNKLPTITAGAMQMSQLFQNLIANSLKFRTKKAPHIHISTKREGEYIIFSLRDNGIGIDERYADKIFSMFARLHTHQEYPGTGIGLAICKKIVDHHGGKIWIEAPKNGCGTIFHFSIPVNPVKFPAQET
jgi:light-regulated signal transduction histidine kinase (bacteriophytochrome)